MAIALYNADRGEFLGLEKRLPYIMVRDDQDKAFFFSVTIKVNQ